MAERLTRDELLVLLIEEAGEVIQAATKALRFGFDARHKSRGCCAENLSAEVGDLLGIVDQLPLDQDIVRAKRWNKADKAAAMRQRYGVRQ